MPKESKKGHMSRTYEVLRLSLPAILVLVIGLGLTLFLFSETQHIGQEEIALDLQQNADQRVVAIQDSFNSTLEGLQTLNRLFQINPAVSREQFETFAKPILARHTYIQAFGFQRVLPGSERAGYESAMRRDNPDFSVAKLVRGVRQPVPEKDSYLIVDYVSPMRGNERALGLDVSDNAVIVAADESARETNLPTATDLFQLVQETGIQRGFLVTMPVFEHALLSSKDLPPLLLGYTTAVFRSGFLVEKSLASRRLLQSPGIAFKISAGESISKAQVVFQSAAQPVGDNSYTLLTEWLMPAPPPPLVRSFDMAGKAWHVTATVLPDYFASRQFPALTVLLTGTALSLLLALYLRAQASHSHRVEVLVEHRTAELLAANESLTRDNAARKRAELALRLRERAIEASVNAVVITSAAPPNFEIEYINPAFGRITGYQQEEVIGRSCNFLWGQDDQQSGIREIAATGHEQREGHATLRCYRKDGSVFWSEIHIAPVRDEDGKVVHFVAVLYDVTETKQYQAELEMQANRDGLTGLANRNLLIDRLNQAITSAASFSRTLWVAYLDMDRFKFINDTVGHKVGDRLLIQIATRLQDAVRDTDTIARVGADEFILILQERGDELLVAEVVQRFLETIAQPLADEGHEFFLTCSIGVAVYPSDGSDAESLIKHADVAMYRAKELGRNNLQFFTPAMNQRAMERLRIEGDLRNALERQEFVLHYQPQVDLTSGRIVGMEALLRWQHKELGMVSPARFIGLAEETGLIMPIGAWALRTACMQTREWIRAGFGPLRVAVNLSARQFGQKDLAQSIAAVLKETGLGADCLEIELTESLVMTDVERAIGILRNLNDLGVKLSIDDFGTGYSSLSYLKRFPIDVLKIDQSFVRDITIDADDAAIAVAIISLAHSLKLKVIAEGVETAAQLIFLRRNQCDQMQGYYFSRPVPADEFVQMLRVGKSLNLPEEVSEARQTLMIVETDTNVASALNRLLRTDECNYRILIANNPDQGFEMLALNDVQVVIADQRLSLMSGTEFLAKVKDLYPDTVRILLSGFTALDSVIEAINRGEIYRFFTKPWEDTTLREGVRDAFRHYWLVYRANRLAEEADT
jgi:diguanylate cyclase (GGDEF)-like protein/PAS domain S-box-containing protein